MTRLDHLIARLDAMATVCSTYERRRTAAEAAILLKQLQSIGSLTEQIRDLDEFIKWVKATDHAP